MAGRPMQSVPADAPPALTELALKLRALRGGVPLREIEAASGISRSGISRAMSGRELLSLSTVRRIVAACGGDWETFQDLWRAADQERSTDKRLTGARVATLEERVERLERIVLDMQARCHCST